MTDAGPFLLTFDMDGVLYRGAEALPDAAASLVQLRGAGFLLGFLTNNSWYPVEEYVTKLARMGIESRPEEYMTSAMAAGILAADEYPAGAAVAVGGPGLQHCLTGAGLHLLDPIDLEGPQPDLVVAGVDWNLTYAKLARAQRAILGGAAFWATNVDPRYPVENGHFLPGAGATVAALEASTGIAARLIGKPSSLTVELLMEARGVAPRDTLMIGDQLATDILAGNRAGCRSALVTTGVSSAEEAEQCWGDRRPTAVFESLASLTESLCDRDFMIQRREPPLIQKPAAGTF